MICDRVNEHLSAYRDGEMSRLHAWRIRGHLQRCARCAASSDEADGLDFELQCAVERSEAPDYLTYAVLRRLPAMPPPARRLGWRSVRVMVGAAIAALQAAALWGAYRYGFQQANLHRNAPSLRSFGPVEAVRGGPDRWSAVRLGGNERSARPSPRRRTGVAAALTP